MVLAPRGEEAVVEENSLTTSETRRSRRVEVGGERRERAVDVSGALSCCGVSQKM